MKHTYTVNDGLRMMGQLLLHNPTTGNYYKNVDGKACYCFLGAGRRVARELKINLLDLLAAARVHSNCPSWIDWDQGTDELRASWAGRLAELKLP